MDGVRKMSGRQSRRRFIGGGLTGLVAGTHGLQPGLLGLRASAQQVTGRHVQAVATAHESATSAGMAILEAGGSAADAAISIAAVLSVVEGWFSSVLGGGTWALYYDAETGEVTSLDGVGPTGSNATSEDYEPQAADPGIHQSVVPGAWDGWMLWLERYGRLDLGDVLAPAIEHARNGHPASADLAWWADARAEQVFGFPAAERVYAPDGVTVAEGELVYMPDLADTFEALVAAYDGALGESRAAAIQAARDYFYRGPLAEAIVAYSDENGGYLTLPDFNDFEAEIVTPVSIRYREDIEVYENPPNSQGMTMLLALNILKEMGLSDYDIDDPNAVHLQIEAMKLAMADRYAHIGDPARVDIPLEALLSDEYAAQQRERIDMDSALTWPIESGIAGGEVPAHTTTFQIVDRDGNAATVTTSLGAHFLIIGDTGIHINNRMRMLSVEVGNANELTPGYKVRHTSCPYLVLRDGRLYFLGGNTGHDVQTQGQLQQFLSVVEFGLNAQEAIDRPRWVSTAFPAGTPPWEATNQLDMQRGFTPTLLSQLQVKGHDIVINEGTFGTASMIIVDDDGADAEIGVEPTLDTSSGEVIPAGS